MIQRIQTIYLFLAALVLPLLFLVPFLGFSGDAGSASYSLFGGEFQRADGSTLIDEFALFPGLVQWVSRSHPYVMDESIILSSILLGLPFLGFIISIFLFRKRKRQIRFVYFSMALLLVFIIPFLSIVVSTIQNLSSSGLTISPLRSFGVLIPFISLTLSWLAVKNIKKDEELVRSADRIR
jgi:hypothetical protein